MKTSSLFCFIFLLLGSNAYSTEYAVNGDFETGDFTGWAVENDGLTVWQIGSTGYNDPYLGIIEPLFGTYSPITLQLEPSAQILLQLDVTIPAHVYSANVSWFDRITNLGADYELIDEFSGQYFLVGLRFQDGDLLDNVLFLTEPGDPLDQPGPNFRSQDVTALLQDHEGEDASLFFRVSVDRGPIVAQVDDISFDIGTTIPVLIDIKPGSSDNPINNNGHGVIPVAILGSATFDVSAIDIASVSLQGLTVKTTGKGKHALHHFSDVNADGYIDLFCQIDDSEIVFSEGDTVAELRGQLTNGADFRGEDFIILVP